jgi:hypothetical protein
MIFETGKYRVEIYSDETYSFNSVDNINEYERMYLDKLNGHLTSRYGIKIYEVDKLLCSAMIGTDGAPTSPHRNRIIVEENRIVICCGNSVFCLILPDLQLEWKSKVDEAACLEIFKYKYSYIVHGELEISRVSYDGKILWKQSGGDIFTTPNGKNDFKITDNYILATDWEGRKYKFDFEGNKIK